jgi:hypothetical protein
MSDTTIRLDSAVRDKLRALTDEDPITPAARAACIGFSPAAR